MVINLASENTLRLAVELDGDAETRADLEAAGWTWVAADPDAIAAAVAGRES